MNQYINGSTMEPEKKYFACPECGARYKVIFNGKKYRCKKCSTPFKVPIDDNFYSASKRAAEKKHKKNNKYRIYKNSIISVIVLTILIVFINKISNYYSPYQIGNRLYEKGDLESAKYQYDKVSISNKNHARALEMIRKIENELERIRLQEEAMQNEIRKAEINRLQTEVRAMPHSNYKANYDIYNRLSTLAPENESFKNKKDYYYNLYTKQQKAEEEERIRLANLNNTGMWLVGHYVDDFGEPTKTKYITNTNYIRGTFSNTATQDSRLNIKFLITNSTDVDIQLYEYAGNNPVKAYTSDEYTVLLQDKDRNRYRLKAINYSDRLSFNKEASWRVHHSLEKGGRVSFKIIEDETPTTIYEFTIQNADFYDNAYRKLRER